MRDVRLISFPEGTLPLSRRTGNEDEVLDGRYDICTPIQNVARVWVAKRRLLKVAKNYLFVSVQRKLVPISELLLKNVQR